jgi:uroporphyrinogen III methyltransferase/synthase
MQQADPLTGYSILLTRPEGRSAGLARRLRSLGADVAERPTIEFEEPPQPDKSRDVVGRLSGFDWIVFSSATGVRFFLERLVSAGLGDTPVPARIAAVGPGTAEALERAGWKPSLVAAQSHAEGLASALRQELAAGDRVLWVRPETARAVLSEALETLGALVEAVVFYRTVPARDAAEVGRAVREGRFHGVVFTSPSTLQMLLEASPETRDELIRALRRAAVVAIGPVTALALERAGITPKAIASSPREEAVVAAVRSALEL